MLKISFMGHLLTTNFLFCHSAYTRIDQLRIKAGYTEPAWIKEFLEFPLSENETAVDIENKLMKTGIFASVRANIVPPVLELELEEKWTLIPVLRAAYGGGTPLVVVGGYERHLFGVGIAVGVEARRYGSAPWGSVLWANATLTEKFSWYLENWRIFRERSLYDEHDQEFATFRVDESRTRAAGLWPLYGRIKVGPDLTIFNDQRKYLGIRLESGLVGPWEGFRVEGRSGLFDGNVSFAEARIFWLGRWERWGLATHGTVGSYSPNEDARLRYYLGGFDSVRGLPDGILSSVSAQFANFEIRRAVPCLPTLECMVVAFHDLANADAYRSAIGGGIRIAYPKVYRLMLRIDYAQSLENPRTRGISAGMNQFIDPGRPIP